MTGTEITYYETIEIQLQNGNTEYINAGDTVAIQMSDRTITIGEIILFWDTKEGSYAEVRYYEYMQNLPRSLQDKLLNDGRVDVDRRMQLCETDHVTEIPVEAIIQKVAVHDTPVTENKDIERLVYWCTHFYSATATVLLCIDKTLSRLTRSRHLYSKRYSVYVDLQGKNKRKSTTVKDNNHNNDKDESIEKKEKNIFLSCMDGVLRRLKLDDAPSKPLCRDEEYEKIYSLVKTAIESCGSPNPIYISGRPGVGKTLVVKNIIQSLEKERDIGQLASFRWAYVNGMRLRKSEEAYVVLYHLLFGKLKGQRPPSAAKACAMINKRYSENPGDIDEVLVLVVDEMDLLLTQRNSVLYNILEWQTHEHARLVVIGLANLMDLPELLPHRLHSRMGSCRIVFKPYKEQQLNKIILQRIGEGKKYISKNVVSLISKSVANESGDVRRALFLTEKTVQNCLKRLDQTEENDLRKRRRLQLESDSRMYEGKVMGKPEINGTLSVLEDDYAAAKSDLMCSAVVSRLSKCRAFENMFLSSLYQHLKANNELQQTKKQMVDLDDIKVRMNSLAKCSGKDSFTSGDIREIAHTLMLCGLVSVENYKHKRGSSVLSLSLFETMAFLEKNKEYSIQI